MDAFVAKPLSVVFRVDASTLIGSGHLMRCLTLGEGLRYRGHRVLFVSRALPGSTFDQISAKGFPCLKLPRPSPKDFSAPSPGMIHGNFCPVSQGMDASQTLDAIGHVQADILIVDHYGLDAKWEDEVANGSGVKIGVIDDLADRAHACSLLVDQNLYLDYSQRYSKLAPAGCALMLGPDYALVRPQFVLPSSRHIPRKNMSSRIVIMFGGADTEGYGIKAAKAALEIEGSIVTLMGLYDPPILIESIALLIKRYQHRINFVGYSTVPWEHMAQADIFVGAGGSSTWERCALGLPGIVYAISENQVAMSKYLGDQKYQIYLGKISEFDGGVLTDAIQSMLPDAIHRAFSETCASLVDGHGVSRIVHTIESSGRLSSRA